MSSITCVSMHYLIYNLHKYNAVPLKRGPFSPKSSHKTPHSSPVRARYVVSFVGPTSYLYSASISAMMYAISCYTRPRYNGTGLYMFSLPPAHSITMKGGISYLGYLVFSVLSNRHAAHFDLMPSIHGNSPWGIYRSHKWDVPSWYHTEEVTSHVWCNV